MNAAGWGLLLTGSEAHSPLLVFLLFCIFFFGLLFFPLFFVLGFIERKLAADLQARVGPNRTPGRGLFQNFADLVKLSTKSAEAKVQFLSILSYSALFSTIVFLPFGRGLIFIDHEMGVFFPVFLLGLAGVLASVSPTLATQTESLFFAQKKVFYWMSSLVPALLAMALPVLRSSSGSWTTILSDQGGSFLDWNFLRSPFQFTAGLVFLLSGMVHLQLPPFHDLDQGAHRDSGIGLVYSNVARFYSTWLWSMLATGLFLGGGGTLETETPLVQEVIQLFSFVLKSSLIFLLIRVVARALPQLRQDQASEVCWRVFVPLLWVCIVGEVLWLLALGAGSGNT